MKSLNKLGKVIFLLYVDSFVVWKAFQGGSSYWWPWEKLVKRQSN